MARVILRVGSQVELLKRQGYRLREGKRIPVIVPSGSKGWITYISLLGDPGLKEKDTMRGLKWKNAMRRYHVSIDELDAYVWCSRLELTKGERNASTQEK